MYKVKARKAIESLYDRTCTIIEYNANVNPINKRTEYEEDIVLENQPCRVSYKTISTSSQSDASNNISQITKLFIAPEIQIKEGSKIIVTKGNLVETYKNSGIPAVYDTHQEIVLENYKEEA